MSPSDISLSDVDRRQFLRYSGAAAMIGAAGCADDVDDDAADDDEPVDDDDDDVDDDDVDDTDEDDDNEDEEEFPTQPLEHIVPHAEGGGSDTYARQFMPAVAEILGTDVQITNTDGAGGLRGADEVRRADPDGYTTTILSPPSEMISAIFNPPDWEMSEEFTGISTVGISAWTLIVNPDEDVETFDEVREMYETGEWTAIGAQESGSINHIIAELIREMDEYDIQWQDHVPYEGTGPITEAVVSGEIPAGIGTETGVEPAVNEGDADVIITFTSEGSSVFPDLPTVTDEGYPNIDYVGQMARGFFAPADTPDDVIETYDEAFEEAAQSEELQQFEEDTGNHVEYIGGPDHTTQLMQDAFEEIPEQIDVDELDPE